MRVVSRLYAHPPWFIGDWFRAVNGNRHQTLVVIYAQIEEHFSPILL